MSNRIRIPVNLDIDNLLVGIDGRDDYKRNLKSGIIYFVSLLCIDNYYKYKSPDGFRTLNGEYLDNVINDLKRITVNTGFFNISTRPARKTLLDGRNAHLIIKPVNWWLSLFLPIFYIEHLQQSETGFIILVRSNSLTR